MEKKVKAVFTRDGTELFVDIVDNGSQFWLVATHGIGEHLGRHKYLQSLFGDSLNIFQYDLRGHGRSEGKRAYVDSFGTYLNDLEDCIRYLKEEYQMDHFILFGHSMGALITAGFSQTYFTQALSAKAVIINAPPVAIPGVLGKIIAMVPDSMLNKIAHIEASTLVGGLVDVKYLSHNPAIIEHYNTDKLCLDKLHTKLLMELVNFSRITFSKPLDTQVPSFCSYGTDDGVINVEGLENYFSKVELNFKVTKINGAYHEIHNEIEQYQRPYFEYLKTTVKSILNIKNI